MRTEAEAALLAEILVRVDTLERAAVATEEMEMEGCSAVVGSVATVVTMAAAVVAEGVAATVAAMAAATVAAFVEAVGVGSTAVRPAATTERG